MKKRILYVDDDQDDFQLLEKAFQDINANIELINVSNGYDTIKFLQDSNEENFPSLILMDINMPIMDGKETARLLQIDDKFREIPVVFFSTSASPFDKKTIEKSGSELITKPSLYEEWLAIARNLAQLYCFIFLYSAICYR